MTRIPCTKCGTEILEVTAKANGGLCGPCTRGAGFCVVCGKRVWEPSPSGEFIHVNCALKRRDAAVAASSGISWIKPEDIDWGALQTGILAATRNAFRRIADAHPTREVRHVVVAYRIGEGIRIEPCVTFSDGEYLNASLNDDAFLNELAPFDFAVTRIGESLEGDESEHFSEVLDARTPIMMQAVFNALEEEGFGLPLSNTCVKTLKEF